MVILMFDIRNLFVEVDDKELLTDINLNINEGEIHAIMGPNGAGKSTLLKAIMNHPSLRKKGHIIFNGEDIVDKSTDYIARLGFYYIAQSPVAIEGVKNTELIRTALQEREKPIDIFSLQKLSSEYCELLNLKKNFIHREINVSMSGGEKKKNELLMMLFLEPKVILLDEIDSGLDVDAIKTTANILLDYQKKSNCAIVVISHQEALLNLLKPEYVHILIDKTIKESGGFELVNEVRENGFKSFF